MQVPNSATSALSSFSIVTLAAIGATACVAADLVHEALGHGIASWLTGDRMLSLSTVAIQNVFASRIVSAAGSSANAIAGILSLLLLRRFQKLTPFAYLLWAFGAFNLLNVGYLAVSAATNSGDWANVIVGLNPMRFWRFLLGVAGTFLYFMSFRWIASFMIGFVNRGEIAVADLERLVWPAYLAGGVVLTAASVLNPISPSLILVSGIGASFGLNCGLLFLPAFVTGKSRNQGTPVGHIPLSAFWLIVALGSCALFIGILGPGIHFSK